MINISHMNYEQATVFFKYEVKETIECMMSRINASIGAFALVCRAYFLLMKDVT